MASVCLKRQDMFVNPLPDGSIGQFIVNFYFPIHFDPAVQVGKQILKCHS